MVNFNDPALIAEDGGANVFLVALYNLGSPLSPPSLAAMVKLWHTVGGLYM